jgi:hypothetical protein
VYQRAAYDGRVAGVCASRRSVARLTVASVALAAAGAPACVAARDAGSPDRTPPIFAGLRSATTCAPGPLAPHSSRYKLSWRGATDDRTPSAKIVYEISVRRTLHGRDFSVATYTTNTGATAFTTPPLPSDSVYFVVRARDQSGNRDRNRVERQGVNICE